MKNPRAVVPESIMPGYPWLAERPLDYTSIAEKLKTQAALGVPYTQEMIDNAKDDVARQANPDAAGADQVAARYPKAQIRVFDGNAETVTELDAVVAYLQMLGTLVDFAKYDEAGPNLR